MYRKDALKHRKPELFDKIVARLKNREKSGVVAEDYDVSEYTIRQIQAREGVDKREQNDAEKALDPTIRSGDT